jgi:succinate dehydrogenase / fumarate reductase iron-sulfur subunit
VLDALNYTDDLFDTEGNPAPRIRWECSCMQAVCGGCAMVINGVPALACETFADEIKGETLILEPLSKFPVIADLIVDRSVIYTYLTQAKAYLEDDAVIDHRQHQQQYSVAKCLKCGLCLEICPNYTSGERFFGALFANDCYLIATRSGAFDDAIREDYDRHFAAGCSKSLACVDICPMKIPTLSSMAKLNRRKR